MKVFEFMSFNPDWFLTLPGILITAGVVLLLIALVILLAANKKDDTTDDSTSNNDQMTFPSDYANNMQGMDTFNGAKAPDTNVNVFNNIQQPIPNVEQPVEMNQGVFPTPVVAPQGEVKPVQTVDFTPSAPNDTVVPEVKAPSFEMPKVEEQKEFVMPAVEPAPVENVVPKPEPAKPAVSVYGGYNPVQNFVKPEQPVAPVIYGGADPLENTAPLPKVETHTLYNQPEAKVVEPHNNFSSFNSGAVVNNNEHAVPDLSMNNFSTPVAQQPAANQAPRKDEIETLNF